MKLPKDSTLQQVLDGTNVESEKSVNLIGAYASFCDPDTYPTQEELAAYPKNLAIAVGFHPRHSHKNISRLLEESWNEVEKLINYERVVAAVREVGLDHCEDPSTWYAQMDYLRQFLRITFPHKVLVLHCRGVTDDDNFTEVYMTLRYQLKKHLPADQQIYLHCFTGDEYVLSKWNDAFKNLYVDVTRMVANFNHDQRQALKKVRTYRMMPETDAPYFKPRTASHSAPNQLYSVAEYVAPILGVTIKTLLENTASNAQDLFGLTCIQ